MVHNSLSERSMCICKGLISNTHCINMNTICQGITTNLHFPVTAKKTIQMTVFSKIIIISKQVWVVHLLGKGQCLWSGNGSVYDQAKGSVYDQARGSVYDQARGSVYDQARASVYNQARGSVYDQARGSVYDQPRASVHDQPRASVYDQYHLCLPTYERYSFIWWSGLWLPDVRPRQKQSWHSW